MIDDLLNPWIRDLVPYSSARSEFSGNKNIIMSFMFFIFYEKIIRFNNAFFCYVSPAVNCNLAAKI